MLQSPCVRILFNVWIISISFVLVDCSTRRTPETMNQAVLCQKAESNNSMAGLRFEISAGSVERKSEHRVIYRDHASLWCDDNSIFSADRVIVDLDKQSQGKFIEMSGNVSLVKEGFSIRSQRAFTNDPCRYVDFRENIVISFKDGSEIKPQEIRYYLKKD